MVKGRLGLDQRAGLAASGDLGFPHILEHLQGVCECVCVCVQTNTAFLGDRKSVV